MKTLLSLKNPRQWFVLTLLFIAVSSPLAVAQWDNTNWGLVVAPVYDSKEAGPYADAELFAGPDKFGSYYAGVTPNGRKLTPAGSSVQTGMNPLGAVLTPDGKYLITSNDDEREGGYQSFQNAINKGGYSLNVIDTASMNVVSQITTGKFFIGIQATGSGPYTVWASGGETGTNLTLAHNQLGQERFASTLAWTYWQSPQNCMQPAGRDDWTAAMPPSAFRSLVNGMLPREAPSRLHRSSAGSRLARRLT